MRTIHLDQTVIECDHVGNQLIGGIILVSSVKRKIKEVGGSLMYMRKRSGPSRLPRRTPETTGRIEELQLLLHTR